MFNLIEVQIIQTTGYEEADYLNPLHIVRVTNLPGKPKDRTTRIVTTEGTLYSATETPETITQKIRESVIPQPLDRDY